MVNGVSRKGSFLEKTLANLFEKAGFEVYLNSKKFGFETDILAQKGAFSIIVEAKQYDNSYINIGSLLHEWSSKGKSVNADRVLVVIAGIKINEKYRSLASDLGIYLWDEKIIQELIRIDSNKILYREICSYLKFGEVMSRFEKIENSDLSDNIKDYLREQAISLGPREFGRELTKLIKEKENDLDRKEKLRKETEKLAYEKFLRDRKVKRVFLWTISTLIISFIFILIIFILSFNTPEQKLIRFCKEKFNSKIFYFRRITYSRNFNESAEWVRKTYQNSALTVEQNEHNVNYITNNQIPKTGYPIVITWAEKTINNSTTALGFFYCNSDGVI